MTDEQLQTLNNDIESGLVMTTTVEHYEQLQAENKRLKEALEEASHMIYGELYHDHPTVIKVKEALKTE